nr:retrotransposon protein, putative, Ty1-copia subclass [Tanacetum cinerariifolium]
MGYYFYFPFENKIIVARYAEFLEKNLLSQKFSGRAKEFNKIQDKDTPPSENTSEIPMEVEGFEPPQEEVVPIRRSKWIFKKKTDMDGIVHTYIARLVAKGYTQTYRVDYEETFSPIADIRVIRILIAIAAFYDYEIWQMDVKTAFLNGYLDENIYMVQRKGFVDPNHP